ncbi:hypothetical protein ACC691_40900, partial [Rhizobium johnstonii]|uniref:hypothetical protein n=1 Tax=Rhizobium johnstonii TaxID=3019933 RepID=UPI003F944C59
VTVAGADVPWGAILSVVGAVCLLIGLRLVVHDRLVVGACATVPRMPYTAPMTRASRAVTDRDHPLGRGSAEIPASVTAN